MLKKAIIVSAILWALSLVQPALLLTGEHGNWYGMDVLAIGWVGMFTWQFAWLANVTLILTWLMSWAMKIRAMNILLIVTIVLSLQVFLTNSMSIPLNESGACCVEIMEFQSGSYFWFASILVMCFSCLYYKFIHRKSTPIQE